MVGVTPQQRGGSNATTIGMVVAIIVAVVLLGVLIWLFTQQEQLRTTADQATRATNRLARGSDESTAKQMFPDASAPGKTLVGEMNKGLQLICGRTTGNQNDSPQNAVRELDAALDEIRKNMADPEPVSASYGTVTIIKNLHGMFQDERTAREEAEATLAKARNDLDALIAANKELEDNYKGELDKMSAKVDELQRNKNEIEDLKGTELAALKRQISDKQDALDSLRQDRMEMQATFRKEVGKLHQAIDEQGRALADLRGAGTHQAADPMAVAREPIGEVLRALPGDSLVHIDLGKRDKVTLGMTFSVYPGEARVPATGRGKGNIEVVSLGDRTAECRITTPPSPEDPILPGDRVGNIVLSRNRAKKTRICVVGQFDVDFDGQIDARGAEKIKALAERYGAEVVDTVDAMTDYLVVGLEPPGLPEEYKRGEVGEEEAAETRDTAEQEDEYDEGEDEGEDEVEDDEGEDEGEDEVEDDEGEDEGEDEAENGEGEDEGEDEVENGEGEDEGEDEDEVDDIDADEKGVGDEKPKGDVVVPHIKKEAEIDPTLSPRRMRTRTERGMYDEAVERAKLFAVPVLRQEQFFNFIGIESAPDSAKRLRR